MNFSSVFKRAILFAMTTAGIAPAGAAAIKNTWSPAESEAKTAIESLVKHKNILIKETKGDSSAVVCEAAQ